ncbi:MAG: hypothetical protein A2Y40_03420 [Candidatus Margulisbacteria bacterium GWF2_35_9]|nr:MAG: hypothetical protein A2Y40_03420 [Candidatus Margulisbacteria bacterium GWF2_35_9]
MNVAVLGASPKEDRYSNMAVKRLLAAGHRVFPIHPVYQYIEGLRVYKNLIDIDIEIHTMTMYVNSIQSSKLIDEILELAPKRIIFNPGAENPELQELADEQGIQTLNACTLVMLSTKQF